MRIDISADIRQAAAALADVHRRQVPFATAKAINATLLEVQNKLREKNASTFILRKVDFARRMVKINPGDFATKGKLTGRVGIQGPGADIFTKFETGGVKMRHGGRNYIAVPRVGSLVKKNPRSIVPEHLRPKSLRRSLTLRTFIKRYKSSPDQLGIFAVDRKHEARLATSAKRARGKGRKVSDAARRRARPMLLYALERAPKIPKSLGFEETARRVIVTRMETHLRAAIETAIATAKPRTA